MKNTRNIFALFILLLLTTAIYSCDSDVTIDGQKTEVKKDDGSNVILKTGNQGNETTVRNG